MQTGIWTADEAEERLDEVIDQALSTGPQRVIHEGRCVAVVVSADEWEKLGRAEIGR